MPYLKIIYDRDKEIADFKVTKYYKLKGTPQTEEKKDFDRIYDYIYDDFNKPIAAEKTVKGILDKIGELKEYPRRGSVWYLENNIDSGF